MRLKLFAIPICLGPLFLFSQCVIDFSYSLSGINYYTFINTSNPFPSEPPRWSVLGPGNLRYIEYAFSPSFYFPVNGMYYIHLDDRGVNCQGFKIDSVLVTGQTPSGNCNADFTNYPTTGLQMNFTSTATASDSIVSYSWSMKTFDNFAQSFGVGQSSLLSMYGGSSFSCIYTHREVVHSVTTITGCQNSKVDTIDAYCNCVLSIDPNLKVELQNDNREISLSAFSFIADTISSIYWQISYGDSLKFDTINPFVLVYDSSVTYKVCVNMYDAKSHCREYVCEDFSYLKLVSAINEHEGINPHDVRVSKGLLFYESFSSPERVKLIDISGRTVFETTSTPGVNVYDVSLLNKGIYLVIVQSSDSFYLKKMFLNN